MKPWRIPVPVQWWPNPNQWLWVDGSIDLPLDWKERIDAAYKEATYRVPVDRFPGYFPAPKGVRKGCLSLAELRMIQLKKAIKSVKL